MNYFNKFYSLINFTKLEEDPLSNYFSISNGFLYRRDKYKLVGMKSTFKKANFNYDFNDLENIQNCINLSLNDEGILNFNKKDNIISSLPLDIDIEKNYIKSLDLNDEKSVFFISSKDLSKQISVIQRKAILENINLSDIIINLDTISGRIYTDTLKHSSFINIKNKDKKEYILKYNFLFFRDLLINSNKFNSWIEFNVLFPFLTTIIYDSNIFSSIMHSK